MIVPREDTGYNLLVRPRVNTLSECLSATTGEETMKLSQDLNSASCRSCH